MNSHEEEMRSDPLTREEAARVFGLAPQHAGIAPPRYVNELAGICRRHGIECALDTSQKTFTMKPPAEPQSYTGALTAALADARSHHPDWTIIF